MKPKELTICGLAAVRARFAREPNSIQRLFFDRATSRQIGALCQALAQAKKIYRCVEPAELEKIAGSVHHGGIVAVVNAPGPRRPRAEDLKNWAAQRAPVLVLDRIGNAHNLGALARTAAFFGVQHLVIPESPVAARPNDAAYRVAEGGLERVTVWTVASLPEFLAGLRATGYAVIGAATRGGRPETATKKGEAVALVLGNEEHGLEPKVAAACTRLVTIPGGNAVESLNVSVAGAVLLWELIGRRPG
ncbi:MAG: RNA methyltransferase [Opitutaceae bacterium]|nr:RNA methyltransferase [Opitutaceae bacterium]MBP9913473.1 RNA methyltransferase [Opitutaceae bacterium]